MPLSTHEIQAWTYRLIDRVRKHQPAEDDHAELKSQWVGPPIVEKPIPAPEPISPHASIARQIAALCNTARGEPALWLVGVDEKAGSVTGAPQAEFSDWWSSVAKHFDGQKPTYTVSNVELSEGLPPVVAVLFDTGGGPFVVRNPVAGRPGSGPVVREVPWRQGNAVQSATHEQLLSLLLPTQKLPQVEVVKASVRCQNQSWMATAFLYVVPPALSRVVFPEFRCRVDWRIADVEGGNVPGFYQPEYFQPIGGGQRSPYLVCTATEAVVSGPALVRLRVPWQAGFPCPSSDAAGTMVVELFVAEAGRSVRLSVPLVRSAHRATAEPEDGLVEWDHNPHHNYRRAIFG